MFYVLDGYRTEEMDIWNRQSYLKGQKSQDTNFNIINDLTSSAK